MGRFSGSALWICLYAAGTQPCFAQVAAPAAGGGITASSSYSMAWSLGSTVRGVSSNVSHSLIGGFFSAAPESGKLAVFVTVSTDPPGRTFAVDGSTYTAAASFPWPFGSAHTVSTTQFQPISPTSRYAWTTWSDGGTLTHSATPQSNGPIIAQFRTQLLVTVTPGAGGTVIPPTGFFDQASLVSFQALADTSNGYVFDRWIGEGAGSYTGQINPAPVLVDAAITQTAAFRNARNDSTLLLLRFDGSPNGELGETPVASTGWSYEPSLAFGTGAYLGPGNDLRYLTAGNIDGTSGTIEFYIRPRWNGNDGQDHYAVAVGLAQGLLVGKDAGNFWRIILNRFGGPSGPELGAGLYIDDWQANQWHHAAFTWSPAALKVYVDGVLKVTELAPTPPPPLSAGDLQIGGDGNAAYLDAVLDDIRISARERSAAEIRSSLWHRTGVEGETKDLPNLAFRLGGVSPNPSSSGVTLSFSTGGSGDVEIRIVDVHGRRIRSLVSGSRPAGQYFLHWDGRGDSGEQVGSGVYWIVGSQRGKAETKKVVLLR